MGYTYEVVSWALQFEYMSKLEISYIYQKSSWLCIADSSKFTEETINFLTAHSYDPDFQITHPEHKKLNNRLESLDNTSILDEEDEEEDENTIDNEDNINLEGSEELILKEDLKRV
ncbi:24524_t:CDS:2, partial [Entrophospora sp. SA101]